MADEEIILKAARRPTVLKKIFRHIDEHVNDYIDALREMVSIQSDSSRPAAYGELHRMAEWIAERLKQLGCALEIRKNGNQDTGKGKIPLPPIILAALGDDPNKITLLIYGHYDVQPAQISDGWTTDPYVLTEQDGMLFGRGSTDDKGPTVGWLHAIQAYQQLSIEIPVNLKFVFEGLEEVRSDGLEDLLKSEKLKFLRNVDMVCISDSYWLGKNKPCLSYGLRGNVYFCIEVEMGKKDLHSGTFGGTVREAMPDLIWLLNHLVDDNGEINIPGILDDVCPLTDDETEMYKSIEFDCKSFQEDAEVYGLRYPDNKVETLLHRWRWPALSIHGIQGAYSGPGVKKVIPRKVIGKFSIRLVPNQMVSDISYLVETFVKERWQKRRSPNTMRIYRSGEGSPSWTSNPFHPSYRAGRQAIAHAYGKTPDLIRDGGSIPAALLLQEVTGKNVLLLPMGSSDDGAHSEREKINISNFIEGTKVMAAYLYELGKVKIVH